MSSNAPIANNNKYLHKKCYYGDTLEGMPWAKTNIDLSFPEIKNVVDLDQKQNPQLEAYYTLGYLQNKTNKMAKNDAKIQNSSIDID